MRILLVWPNRGEYGLKTIGVSLVSAILKRMGHEVELFDTTFFDLGLEDASEKRSSLKIFKHVSLDNYNMEKVKVDLKEELFKRLDEFKPDMVGVSALFSEIFIGLQITDYVKEWDDNTLVVWGNKIATMSPEKLLLNKNVDCVYMGEGINGLEEFIRKIDNDEDYLNTANVAYLNNGRLVKNRLLPYFQDLDSLPYLDWSIFDKRQFVRSYDGKVYIAGDHMLTWGCPNRCTYCINHAYRDLYKTYCSSPGKFIRSYSIDRAIEELEFLKNRWDLTFYKFQDEDFCLKPVSYLEEFTSKYKDRIGLPFAVMANARNATMEKLSMMKDMGCVSVSIGIESGNRHIRREVLKRTESLEDIERAVKDMNSLGIRTSSFNMLGLPFDNRDTIMETVDINRKSQVLFPNSGFFYPLEKTVLRQTSIDNDFFDPINDEMIDTNNPCLHLKELTTDELVCLRDRFVLYIKMPEEYISFIERSEIDDDIGRKLFVKLCEIYENCILNSGGVWSDDGRKDDYINELISIGENNE